MAVRVDCFASSVDYNGSRRACDGSARDCFASSVDCDGSRGGCFASRGDYVAREAAWFASDARKFGDSDGVRLVSPRWGERFLGGL